MSSEVDAPAQDSLLGLMEEGGIARVAIVDDAFDSMAQRGLAAIEESDLWARLEFDEEFHRELDRLGRKVEVAEDFSGELIDELLTNQSGVPRFMKAWPGSIVGNRRAEAITPVSALQSQLAGPLDLDVQTFGTDAEPSALVAFDPQLLFLDWYLGDDGARTIGAPSAEGEGHSAVQTAIGKAKAILEEWPAGKPKPLIVLMSSKPGVEADAEEFCRDAEILRGMFYAVPKSTLNDEFSLRLHLSLFAMSLPAGRRIQAFMDTLRHEYESARRRFSDAVSDLTLTDYAYIQRLCLQNEGQPLGDYLVWLFSTYMGQLLFAEALTGVRKDLDSMTFEQALPSLGPPSGTLAEIYYKVLFDTSVGSVESHPLAGADGDSPLNIRPAIALGDIFRREGVIADVKQTADGVPHGSASREEAPELPRQACVEAVDPREEEDASGEKPIDEDNSPDLLLLINAQCDLEFRPEPEGAAGRVDSLSVLLLPGTLRPLGKSGNGPSKPKTELYQQGGQKYRIEWDTKKVQAIPFSQFRKWMRNTGYERSARLRLPFVLEIQRAFAAELSRIGSPVSPPIYQPISAQLLRPDSESKAYEAINNLEESEAAFLVLTRDGQQCVLTIPLMAKLKALLEAEGVTLSEADWAILQSPFRLPTSSKSKTFADGRFRIENGATAGQICNSSIAVTLSLSVD